MTVLAASPIIHLGIIIQPCTSLAVPPPTYESLFGRVREVQKSSNGLVDFIKNLIILFLGTSKSMQVITSR